MPRLQPSYSTNDIPTMRNAGYSAAPGRSAVGPLVHQPHMGHSLGDRMRHARDTPISERSMMPPMTNTFSAHGGPNLQLIPFPVSGSFMGPSITSPAAGPFGGYGNFNSLNHSVFSSRSSARNHGELTLPSHPHPQSLPHSGSGRSSYKMRHDPRHDPRQENRQENRQDPRQDPRNDPEARFANATMESLVGQIYGLCKDQHGCRFLQKKLEEGNPTYVEMIFKETHPYVVELMTDPFGNYLCQKLLDFANDEQRTVLVQTAAPRLVTIALNQHGTRALQKMIESLRTPEQINIVINALKNRVVELIKDLNGNHVIQKCLNRLKSEDAQFIFDAVGEHCIEVGTHRHGCCVLQRCIDHADGEQKGRLIQQITLNSLALVQDAFGNYVVQYILDLGEAKYSEPVVLQFRGRVCDLAKQKFSSNVIEKCIRVAEPATKKILIEELADPNEIQDVLKDCYANYVVQTAVGPDIPITSDSRLMSFQMDYSDLQSSLLLYRRLESLTQAIRGFPYGKRIQSKLQSLEARINAAAPGTLTRTRTYSLGAPSSATQSPPRTSGNVQQNQLLDGQTNNQQKGHLSNLLNGQEDKPQQVPSTAAPPPAPFPSQDGPGNYNVHM
ncbi:ARM repeat-containing protein [Ascodesmis nigricans]|uniref:ARM repeat-containing protein n=1 Tax=Ascodesmis nigricans TaxID=341454 RepID=A0A4S2MLA5_9PEZI|nr:ARM repeat-containing protein [Ascodesmis nigricans]